MGSEWVDGGPSLGSALAGVFGKFEKAPGAALEQMALADKIAWDRRTKLANVFSGGARKDEGHAPLFGEHTRAILAEAGYSKIDIDKMLAAGAVIGASGGK